METPDKLKGFYKPASIAAIIMVLIIPVQVVVFIVWPPPGNALDYFLLFQQNWFLGLLSLDLLYMLNNILLILVYLGLYAVLKQANQAYMLIALVLGLVGIAVYFSSAIAFEMLSLSNQYAMADTAELKRQCLASGQMLLAVYKGSAFNVYYVLNAITLLLISVVMLRDLTFSRATAIWGLVSGILMLVPTTAGDIGLLMGMTSLIPWTIFCILVALRLFTLNAIYSIEHGNTIKGS